MSDQHGDGTSMSQPWVLVTGGARRLGRVFCLAFARAGWNVLCHYQQSKEAALTTCADITQLARMATAVHADLGDPEQRIRLMQQAMDASAGALGAVVNSASLFEPDVGLNFSQEVLQQSLQTNLVAPMHLGSLLAQHVQSQASGSTAALIHVLDQKVVNLNPDYFSYTVSKLALERAVALQAQALAPYVRVSGLAPGLVLESGPQSEANFSAAKNVNLLRSPINPDDVAQAAVFLAGNASITGTTLLVDKGQHLTPTERDVMFVVDNILKGRP